MPEPELFPWLVTMEIYHAAPEDLEDEFAFSAAETLRVNLPFQDEPEYLNDENLKYMLRSRAAQHVADHNRTHGGRATVVTSITVLSMQRADEETPAEE